MDSEFPNVVQFPRPAPTEPQAQHPPSGDDQLRQLLRTWGFDPGRADVSQAVIALQRKLGLPPSGAFDDMTRAACAQDLMSPASTIRAHQRGQGLGLILQSESKHGTDAAGSSTAGGSTSGRVPSLPVPIESGGGSGGAGTTSPIPPSTEVSDPLWKRILRSPLTWVIGVAGGVGFFLLRRPRGTALARELDEEGYDEGGELEGSPEEHAEARDEQLERVANKLDELEGYLDAGQCDLDSLTTAENWMGRAEAENEGAGRSTPSARMASLRTRKQMLGRRFYTECIRRKTK